MDELNTKQGGICNSSDLPASEGFMRLTRCYNQEKDAAAHPAQ